MCVCQVCVLCDVLRALRVCVVYVCVFRLFVSVFVSVVCISVLVLCVDFIFCLFVFVGV